MSFFTSSRFSFVDLLMAIVAGFCGGIILARIIPELMDIYPWALVVFIFLCFVRFVFVAARR